MSQSAENIANPASTDLDIFDASTSMRTLFRHTKRELWGLAIVLSKQDDRVLMQFEDGRARAFADGYYHMLDAVDRPFDVSAGIVNALWSMGGHEEAPAKPGVMPVSFDEQKAYFASMYEDGFQDVAYSEKHRGDGRKSPLKRHRDALVARAEALSKPSMSKWMRDGDYTAIHKAATKVANVTDLVVAKERKLFAAIGPEHHEAIATSLFALLHGKSKLAQRMDGFTRALRNGLGEAPSWGLASVFLGAVHPEEHVVVRGKVLALQAAWMAPGLRVSDAPMGLLYERLAKMVKDVKLSLETEGFAPRDTLDVVDFMWATLRPMAQKEILKARKSMRVANVSAAEAESERDAA